MNSINAKSQRPHPRAKANPFSILTFGWTYGIFWKGFKKDLEMDDLYGTLDEDKSELLGNRLQSVWNEELKRATIRKKKPSLAKIIFICFGPKAVLLGSILGIMEIVFRLSQPMFLGGLISYFTPDSDVDKNMAFLYAACIVICSLVNVVTKQAYMLAVFHMGMKLRVAVCSLIYRKALKLSKSAMRETTVGQAVNLLSNDVNRFDICLLFGMYIFIAPVHSIIMAYVIWHEIGVSAFAGIATIMLFIPIQVSLGKRVSTLRMRTAKKTDERIRFMNEIIVGIQVIKMYAWEKPFAYLISVARRVEVEAIRSASYTRGILLTSEKFITRIAIFVSILTYYLLDNKITAAKVFVVTAYFNIFRYVMTDFFPRAIQVMAECSVSVKRIQNFLLYDEVRYSAQDRESAYTSNKSIPVENGSPERECDIGDNGQAVNRTGIKIIDISAKWCEDLPDNTLTNVNLMVEPGGLVAVIGPVGSGKTSLLHAILKELPLSSGTILVGGSISYSSQEAWVFSGSVRQNILFGQPMNKERYRQVVRVCVLERDFELLPHADRTIVGERGVTLSGGQRARINLARAIYKEADVYLLDDPLSAVDTHVGRHLFDDCVCEFLRGKTRLLVTHQLQYLQAADSIVILKNGIVEATGTFSQLQESGLDFARQLGLEADGDERSSTDLHSTSSIDLKRQNSETSQKSLVAEHEPQQASEMRSRGKVNSDVYREYFKAAGHWVLILLVVGVYVLAQIAMRGGDYWMAYWTNVEEMRLYHNSSIHNGTLNHTSASGSSDFMGTSSNIEDNTTALHVSNVSTSTVALDEFQWMPSTETCVYIYVALVLSIAILTISSAFCFFAVCMRASIKLHNAMFSCIIRARMAFFNRNPSGQILNRFAKDMGSIDESLPITLMDCIQTGLSLLGVVILVAVVNLWLLIPTVFMFFLFYFFRMYYLATSRSLKRLEAITRSPVFSHLNASLQGLTTIRAFQAESLLEKEFDNHQDIHSSVWYLYISINRAFGLWLDGTCVMYIMFVTLSFLLIGGEQYGGDVGLAITQAIGLTGMLQWGIRQSAEMENQMTSVERVLEYTHMEKEPSEDNILEKRPPAGWPTRGAIVFDRVCLKYSSDEPAVLKYVSFVIKPAEKVGVVGRTGAGKSSLITALFRLVELSGGSIRIDGVETYLIGLHDLRSKISIIPQEPALFSGPLRDNLDPFSEYSDAVLWSALAEVELKQAVEELPAGLSHKVSEGGSNFSVGQRQLLCLARAIIRKNKILVLDEATANVDPQTDELIQATIRRKFADCTVLTIAHRLHTVMDSDRILVMDAGCVVEFDHPHVLLENKEGLLYKLVQQTGHAMAESLIKIARNSFEKLKKE